jgi:hypothetical protein
LQWQVNLTRFGRRAFFPVQATSAAKLKRYALRMTAMREGRRGCYWRILLRMGHAHSNNFGSDHAWTNERLLMLSRAMREQYSPAHGASDYYAPEGARFGLAMTRFQAKIERLRHENEIRSAKSAQKNENLEVRWLAPRRELHFGGTSHVSPKR